ncbi:3'-5' exonuclease, partial [Latilactobacillus fuchuensis]|uniref:3'-5' exonuclease n=1 Tax=Latilactobacillus fuchuensis TaxID=164393 RepID=UPI0020C78266
MLFEISLDGIKTSYEKKARTTRDKGKSIISLPQNFTLIDIETTGLDPKFDDIIEIGAIKVVNNQPVNSMSTLVLPDSYEMEYELPIFIENLTGITTNELRTNGSSTKSAIRQLLDFVGDDTLMGYNVSFDINFIYDTELNILNQKFENNYIDIMRFSKKLLPDMKHYRVKDMLEIFNIESPQQHRALNDCRQELEIFNILKNMITDQDDFIKSFTPCSRTHSTKLNAKDIHTSKTTFDDSNPFFNQYVAFTGG